MATRREQKPPDLALLNHTELTQMAVRMGIPGASKAVPRSALLMAIIDLEPIDAENPVDYIRDRMKDWLDRYWDVLRMQVPEKRCPDCYKSSDIKVANCWLDNRDQVT